MTIAAEAVTSGHRQTWRWIRPVVAAATLAVLVWRVGTGPFLDGLRAVDAPALLAAAAIAVLTTTCSAWRWQTVARGYGIELPLTTAVAAYYRSLFLNVTLPGGVVGDVHRGLGHGLRAVAWERVAGQAVQIVLTVAVLLVLPSPVQSAMPFVAAGLVAAATAVALTRRARLPQHWPKIALASALALAGYTVTFLIAAHTAGVTEAPARIVPLALLVLAAAALPNVAGWGPREGMTAWAFAAAGIGASRGVATAVVYGVMVFFATLPGAVVLLAGWGRRDA